IGIPLRDLLPLVLRKVALYFLLSNANFHLHLDTPMVSVYLPLRICPSPIQRTERTRCCFLCRPRVLPDPLCGKCCCEGCQYRPEPAFWRIPPPQGRTLPGPFPRRNERR